jgi:hypothetical protein
MNGLLLSLLLLQGTSSIDGTVVQALNQGPLSQTQIVAVPVGGLLKDSKTAVSDGDGRFRIEGLAAGSYRLFFEHDGFVRAEYGQRVSGKSGVPLEISGGKTTSGITIPLTATSAIYGKVVNAANDPVVNATVKALKPAYQNGERSLQTVQSAQTDDRGEYRLFGLPPGNYFLSAMPVPSPYIQGGTLTIPSGNGFSNSSLQNTLATGNWIDPRALDASTELTVYLPGTTDAAAAAPIDLRPGSNLRAPDLRTIRTRTFGVRGSVVDEAGQPATLASATLTRVNSTESIRTSLLAQNRNAFEFGAVLPGVYDLVGLNGATAADKAGYLRITVGNENVENIRLVMQPVIELKGRIVQDSATVPAAVRAQLRGTNSAVGIQINPAAADGSFSVMRLLAGDYRLVLNGLPANLYVRSAKLGTRDALNTLMHIDATVSDRLEIVLSPTTGSLDAFAVDESRRPAAAATVVLVPSEESRQRFDLYRSATTDSAGRAALTNIAPGSYKLFAWQDIEANAWQNADALRPFEERGVPVTIEENERISQTIKVIE